jgi:acetyl esterase
MQRSKTLIAFAAASVLALTAAACSKPAEQPPVANAEAKTATPDADMQAVLDKLASLGGKPIETLSRPRRAPSPPRPTRSRR